MRAADLRSWVTLTAGLLLYSFAWAAFLIPAQIISGGVSGLGQLLSYPTHVPVGVWMLLVNGVLIAVAVRVVGATFGAKTIYGIVGLSIFLTVLQPVFGHPLVEDRFLACIIGASLAGVGVGLAMNSGGSTGGTDIVALILGKYRNVSPGRVILAWDGVVISSSWFLFHSPEKLVYGFVSMGVLSYVVDLMVEGAKQSHQFTIISDSGQAIAQRVSKELGRGVTLLHGTGWYSQEEKEVLLVVVRRDESSRLMRIIHETDPKAFLTVAVVTGAYGLNFRQLRP